MGGQDARPVVLLADDDGAITSNLAPFLDRAGFTVHIAPDGEAALALVERLDPDACILDVLMPRADGREVLRRLRAAGRWLPVVLLTQVGESGERAIALDEGADDYLNKPFDPYELLARLRAVLRRARPGRRPLGPVQLVSVVRGHDEAFLCPFCCHLTTNEHFPDGHPRQERVWYRCPPGAWLRAGWVLVQHLRVPVGGKPAFSAAEMRRRRTALGRELDRSETPYALVYGANRSGAAVSWLTGWPVTREALLIVAPDEDDDVLLVSFFNHVPQARRLSAARVEWAGARAVAAALDLIAARGRLPGRIGLVGALPFDQYRLLAGQVPDVVDLNAAYTGLRLVKSAEEVAMLRRGAALSDAAIAALASALRPGTTDYEVLARTEQAYTAQGGLHHIHYLGITSMDEPALAVPAQWPTGRVIRPGDVATCEISAAAAPEYAGQVLRTFTVGAPPTARYSELHAVAATAFDAIAGALFPGAQARDLAAAAAVVGQAGFTAIDDLVHGFGGGYLPPVVPPPGRGLPAPDFTLAAGMTVVVQPNVVTRDGRAGVQTGELLLVTERGPQRLHAYPQGLQQAG